MAHQCCLSLLSENAGMRPTRQEQLLTIHMITIARPFSHSIPMSRSIAYVRFTLNNFSILAKQGSIFISTCSTIRLFLITTRPLIDPPHNTLQPSICQQSSSRFCSPPSSPTTSVSQSTKQNTMHCCTYASLHHLQYIQSTSSSPMRVSTSLLNRVGSQYSFRTSLSDPGNSTKS